MNKFLPLAGIALAGMISSAAADSPADAASKVPDFARMASQTCEGSLTRLRLVANVQRLVEDAVRAKALGAPLEFKGEPMEPDFFLNERPTSVPVYTFAGTQDQRLRPDGTAEYLRRSFAGASAALSAAQEDVLVFQRDALARAQEARSNHWYKQLPSEERDRLEWALAVCTDTAISNARTEDGAEFVSADGVGTAAAEVERILDGLYAAEYRQSLVRAEERRKAIAKERAKYPPRAEPAPAEKWEE